MEAACQDGHLPEIGCGVAAGSTLLATLHGGFRYTGIELHPEIVAEARRRIASQGLAAKMEGRCLDGQLLGDEACYDLAFWAQPFFPEAIRARILAAIRQALISGGLLLMQELHGAPTTLEALQPPAGLLSATNRLVYSGWGVPFARRAEALMEEAQSEEVAPTRLGSRFAVARR